MTNGNLKKKWKKWKKGMKMMNHGFYFILVIRLLQGFKNWNGGKNIHGYKQQIRQINKITISEIDGNNDEETRRQPNFFFFIVFNIFE